MNRKKLKELKRQVKRLRRELATLQDFVDDLAGDQVDAYELRRRLDFLEGRTGEQAKIFEKRLGKLEDAAMGSEGE